MKKKRRNVIFQISIVVILIAGIWFSFGNNVLAPLNKHAGIPEHLGEMKVATHTKGEEALAQVNQLHGSDIKLESAYIVEYSHAFDPYHGANTERATVWVGKTNSAEAARDLSERMRQAIQKGGSPFTDPQTIKVAGQSVFQVKGPGGEHFFYTSARDSTEVVWLIINSPDTPSLLAEAVNSF